MKINDATLQNILTTYGKQIRADKSKVNLPKEDEGKKDVEKGTLAPEELDIVNYGKDGKVQVDSQKKEALIDFFE